MPEGRWEEEGSALGWVARRRTGEAAAGLDGLEMAGERWWRPRSAEANWGRLQRA